MKQFNDYDNAKKAADAQGSAKLPVGAYVCKIKQVRYEPNEKGDRIALAFDIAEGEYKDFFQKKFDADDSEDKKWKGKVTIWVPKDDGTEQDAKTKRTFAGWTSSFEKSNAGYKWDWDENKWKGLIVGIVFGETGTIIEGKEIVYVDARFGVDVQKVRDGKAPTANFRTRNGYTGKGGGGSADSSDDSFMNIPAGGKETLPF